MPKSCLIERLTPEGRLEYEKWLENPPSCRLINFLWYCINVVGMIADTIVNPLSPKEVDKFNNRLGCLLFCPPGSFKDIDIHSRSVMITNACLWLVSWHEQGQLMAQFYENDFKPAVQDQYPSVYIMSIYEGAEYVDLLEISEYKGSDIPSC